MKISSLIFSLFFSVLTLAQNEVRTQADSQFRINQIRVCDNWVYNQSSGNYGCLSYPMSILYTPVVSDLNTIIVDLKSKITSLEERIKKLENR
jgi:hypothetical protein